MFSSPVFHRSGRTTVISTTTIAMALHHSLLLRCSTHGSGKVVINLGLQHVRPIILSAEPPRPTLSLIIPQPTSTYNATHNIAVAGSIGISSHALIDQFGATPDPDIICKCRASAVDLINIIYYLPWLLTAPPHFPSRHFFVSPHRIWSSSDLKCR